MDISVAPGFADSERGEVAALFWQAFSFKLGKVMGPDTRALAFLSETLDPCYALVARDESGALLGLAGFKTNQGGLINAGLRDMSRHYGPVGCLWRAALLSLLERELKPGVFQMDGIFVTAASRGCGVGTVLLQAVQDEARARGMREVQLDVIDTNPRARALYERVGFQEIAQESTGPLRWVFGFNSATKMSRPVGD
jgi:ribosomal protein S18 acetylase RimI-like enzyme